jgi:hypothetical protein
MNVSKEEETVENYQEYKTKIGTIILIHHKEPTLRICITGFW